MTGAFGIQFAPPGHSGLYITGGAFFHMQFLYAYFQAWWEILDLIQNLPSKKSSQLHHPHHPHIGSLQHIINLMGVFKQLRRRWCTETDLLLLTSKKAVKWTLEDADEERESWMSVGHLQTSAWVFNIWSAIFPAPDSTPFWKTPCEKLLLLFLHLNRYNQLERTKCY